MNGKNAFVAADEARAKRWRFTPARARWLLGGLAVGSVSVWLVVRDSAECREQLAFVRAAASRGDADLARLSVPAARAVCGGRHEDEFAALEVKSGRGSATAGPSEKPPAATAAAPTTNAAAACDANARWFDDHLTGDAAARRTAFVTELKSWSAECRRDAFQSECAKGCDDIISGMLLEAAGPDEKRELLRWRLEKNKRSLASARALLAKVKQLRTYAQSLAGSPRDVSPECISRMRADFARIDALDKEIMAALPSLPQGFVGIRGTLVYAKGCVNCDEGSRWQCAELGGNIKLVDEVLASQQALVSQDEKAVAKLGK